MAWATAISDLRNLLNDSPTQRYVYRKKIFGDLNGVNLSFKTFEFRRLTDFTSATLSASPLGVYLNGVRRNPTDIATDDVASGEFTFQAAMASQLTDGAILEATYYVQWFIDTELQGFLTNASNWLTVGTDYTQVPSGLIPAAMDYAASDALKMQAMRWTMRSGDSFRLDDAPKKEALGVSETMSNLSNSYLKSAITKRDDYYKRAGQANQPAFVSNWGAVSSVTPRR